MKKKLLIITGITLLIAMPLATVFAQTTTTGSGRRGTVVQYTLTVNSNVKNAQIFINGAEQKGTIPFSATLNSDSYTVMLKAPGYFDGTATVNLTASQTVTINLNPLTATLTVTSNVASGQVFINNAAQNNKGMPFSSTLTLGTYNVTVKAPGYSDGSATVNLTANQTVNINLTPLMATVIPMKPHPDFKVFVNGREITAPQTYTPGSYTVRYSIGALFIEKTYNFEAGKAYRFEPVLDLKFTN